MFDRSVTSGVSTDLATEPRAPWWKIDLDAVDGLGHAAPRRRCRPRRTAASGGRFSAKPGGQVVEDPDLVALREQLVGQVRPDEARPTRHQRQHGADPTGDPWRTSPSAAAARTLARMTPQAWRRLVAIAGHRAWSRWAASSAAAKDEFADRIGGGEARRVHRRPTRSRRAGSTARPSSWWPRRPDGALLQGVMGLEEDDKTGVPDVHRRDGRPRPDHRGQPGGRVRRRGVGAAGLHRAAARVDRSAQAPGQPHPVLRHGGGRRRRRPAGRPDGEPSRRSPSTPAATRSRTDRGSGAAAVPDS